MQNEEFCADPFDPSIINDQQRRLGYVDCQTPPGNGNPYSQSSELKTVCKKLIQTGRNFDENESVFHRF